MTNKDSITVNNKPKYRRCKYCQYWSMNSLNDQPHPGYGIFGTCSYLTGRHKGIEQQSSATSCCPGFKEWIEEPEWRKSLFAEEDDSGYGKLAQYQDAILDDYLDEEDNDD